MSCTLNDTPQRSGGITPQLSLRNFVSCTLGHSDAQQQPPMSHLASLFPVNSPGPRALPADPWAEPCAADLDNVMARLWSPSPSNNGAAASATTTTAAAANTDVDNGAVYTQQRRPLYARGSDSFDADSQRRAGTAVALPPGFGSGMGASGLSGGMGAVGDPGVGSGGIRGGMQGGIQGGMQGGMQDPVVPGPPSRNLPSTTLPIGSSAAASPGLAMFGAPASSTLRPGLSNYSHGIFAQR